VSLCSLPRVLCFLLNEAPGGSELVISSWSVRRCLYLLLDRISSGSMEESGCGNSYCSLEKMPRTRDWSPSIMVGISEVSIGISTSETCLGNMFEATPDLATSLRTQGVEHLVFVGLQMTVACELRSCI
jgi:hypothetical protein